MKDDEKYFNVPIQIFEGFMEDSKDCLNNAFNYAVISQSNKLTGNKEERYKAACKFFGVSDRDMTKTKFFGVKSGDVTQKIIIGNHLISTIPANSPKVGLRLSLFWDYYKNEKSNFEKVCLLGYLSIKSILQTKAYCKINNMFWLSRMDGNAKSITDLIELSEAMKPYGKEYQTVKIKTELRNSWGLTTYSRHTRGFYVSFDLTIEQLVFEAEKRRKSTKDKQYKQRENDAIKAALHKLNLNTS
jgi:hypothetical protein